MFTIKCPCSAELLVKRDDLQWQELVRCPVCRHVSFVDVRDGRWYLRPVTEVRFDSMLIRNKFDAPYYPESVDAPSISKYLETKQNSGRGNWRRDQ